MLISLKEMRLCPGHQGDRGLLHNNANISNKKKKNNTNNNNVNNHTNKR